jgi:hypothetical protein
MSIKDVVHSNQSSTVWQVEIPGIPAAAGFPNVFGQGKAAFSGTPRIQNLL